MRNIRLWNEEWMFYRQRWKDAEAGLAPADGKKVTLPHTWYKDGEYYQGEAVYQKVFQMECEEGKKVYLFFEGVEKICRILVNGYLAGEHKGGYSSFAVEIGKFLKKDEDNTVTVLVNNEKGDSVNPISGDFTVFGGIYRSVRMIITEKEHFDVMYYGTKGIIMRSVVREMNGVLTLQPYVCGCDENTAAIRYQVFDMDGKLVGRAEETASKKAEIIIESPHLWNGRENPYMYRMSAELYVGGEKKDKVVLATGFRKIELHPEKGFYLNDRHVKLNGVAKHQDKAEVFSAASEADWKRDMDLIMEIGANAVRLSHYQHPQRVYDLCDEKGLIVWAEIPMLKMLMKKELLENAKQQLKELILQNLHHPSICFWGIQNEIAIFGESEEMYRETERLNRLAKELDEDRISVCANLNSVKCNSRLNAITDAVGYNLYYGWYYGEFEDFERFFQEFHQINPTVPLGISEYGADCNLRFHSNTPKKKDYSEEFQTLFHEKVYPVIQSKEFVWGSFVWNMFDFVSPVRDEGGVKYRNCKGLVTHDRKIKKDTFYYYKAQWSQEPFVHISEKRFEKRKDRNISIKVYSNEKEVELRVNGKRYTVGSDNGVFLFENMELTQGENTVTAYAGSTADQAVFRLVEEDTPEYVFVDPYPGPNVRNWYEDEQEKEKLFPSDSYSIKDTVNDLLKNGTVMKVIDHTCAQVGAFMRDTIGTFTLEEMCVYAKTLIDESNLRKLNETLIQVKKF